MASQIHESIKLIRQYRHICESKTSNADSKAYAKLIIEREWKRIKHYRSDESFTVFLVKGLYEQDFYLENLQELHDLLAEYEFEVGITFTVEIREMTGCEIGRLPILDL